MMNRLLKRGVSLILSAAMVFTLCPQTQKAMILLM